MSDGNKRYLGDVFINPDNYEYQKQFFKDIIESYQWKYGGNFDASTLQGKSSSDFASIEQGNKADSAILTPLLIGKTDILNTSDPQYILSDAIKIDKDDDSSVIPYDNLTSVEYIDLISWFDSLNTKATLSEMLYTLYNKTIEITDNKVNNEEFERLESQFQTIEDNISQVFETFTDENNEEVVKFNANLVNGLRFRLITQEDYDNLSDNERTYWRNIFIIKDPGDIPPDYEDPMQWPLTEGYEFRINDNKIQFKNTLSDNWGDVCTLTDFLIGADIQTLIRGMMEENINDVFENIQPENVETDRDSYPFLSSLLRSIYIKNLLINNKDDYITQYIDEFDSLKYLNIDMKKILIDSEVLDDNGNNRINDAFSSFNDRINSHDASISSLTGAINLIQNDTTFNDRLSSLETQTVDLSGIVNNNTMKLRGLESTISNNTSQINSLKTKVNSIPKLDGWNNISNGTYGQFFYNPAIRLVFFFYYHSQTSLKHGLGDVLSKYATFTGKYASYKPKTQVIVPCLDGELAMLVKTDGTIHYYNVGPAKTLNLRGSAMWPY